MVGIIEIWRKERNIQQPIRFVVGTAPILADGSTVPDSPVVKSIIYRELKTLGNGRYQEALVCINFEETDVQRLIPTSEIVEIAYKKKSEEEIKTPALEQ